METINVLYKCCYEILNQSTAETFDEQEIGITFITYNVIKQTPLTFTISDGVRKHIILRDQSGKRFAYITKERALEAFIIARRSYGGKLRRMIKNNERLLEIAKSYNIQNKVLIMY